MTPESFDDGAFETSGRAHSNRPFFSSSLSHTIIGGCQVLFSRCFYDCQMTSNDLCFKCSMVGT